MPILVLAIPILMLMISYSRLSETKTYKLGRHFQFPEVVDGLEDITDQR